MEPEELRVRVQKIWQYFPHRRHDVKKIGLKAIEKAIKAETKSRKIPEDQASWLIRNAVIRYAQSSEVLEKLHDPNRRQFLPMCSTWMNQARYESWLETSPEEPQDEQMPLYENEVEEAAQRRKQ